MNPKSIALIAIAVVAAVVLATVGSHKIHAQQPEMKTIRITAKRFGFTPNEVHLKRGETVKLQYVSEDVVHGMYVKPLKIDTEIQAGATKEIVVTPATAGKFTAICDHFCGAGHGNMKMTYIVDE